MADVTYSGIMANVAQATAFVSDPRVLAATGTSSFPIEDLIWYKTTIYLVNLFSEATPRSGPRFRKRQLFS